MNIYIAYEVNLWAFKQSVDFMLGNSLFGTVKLTKNAHLDKYKHSGYGIGFDAHGRFSLSDGSEFDKDVIIYGTDMSSYVHVDSRNKYILILGKGAAQGLGVTTLTAEKEYAINFRQQHKKICIIIVQIVRGHSKRTSFSEREGGFEQIVTKK